MISSIHIQGFRGLEKFEMGGLGRLNLLVGTNNSGKTSVLESISLLTSGGDPLSLWQILWRRGERVVVTAPPAPDNINRRVQTELEVCHVFSGHELHPGSKFTISAKNQSPERSISFTVTELSGKERAEMFGPTDDIAAVSRLALQIKGNPAPTTSILPLTRTGGITPDSLEPRRGARKAASPPSMYITPDSLTGNHLSSLWNKISLKPAESLVTKALQFIEPKIERIAIQAATEPFYGNSRGGFIVKLKGIEQPVPLGSMGDGMWRMLAMAIAVTQCSGGVLLIDEIDTGLHYSVMSEMWNLLFSAAKEFDVQIFATTHSFDCIQSLASICHIDSTPDTTVTLQRIEVGKQKAIHYTESEIRAAAETRIEVR